MSLSPPPAPPRIPALDPPFDPATQELLSKMNPPGAPGILALLRVLAVHPALAERMKGVAIELMILAGWYRAISYVCEVAGVPLEPWQARFDEVRSPGHPSASAASAAA